VLLLAKLLAARFLVSHRQIVITVLAFPKGSGG
jgi:hypothetical protein